VDGRDREAPQQEDQRPEPDLLRYEKVFLAITDSKPVVYGVMGTLWVAFFLPVIVVLGKPVWKRIRE